jgi:hypothetical protein
MVFAKVLLVFASVTALAVSFPVEKRAWPSGSVTCGSNVYSLSAVKSATAAGYARINSPIGSSELIPFPSLFPIVIDGDYPNDRQLPTHIQ